MSEAPDLTLLDYLAKVPDFRRKEGRRYPLPTLLVMIVMAIMSGRYGYREIARFLAGNQQQLVDALDLKRKQMPSHVTIRTVMMALDFEALNSAFEAWVVTHVDQTSGLWIAVDAKSIRSTVVNYNSSYQDFVCLVSAFTHKQGLVLAQKSYNNKKRSEEHVTQELIPQLIEALGLKNAVFTLDALHCKKNVSHYSAQ